MSLPLQSGKLHFSEQQSDETVSSNLPPEVREPIVLSGETIMSNLTTENLNKLVGAVLVAVVGVAVWSGSSAEPPDDSWFQRAVLQNSDPVVVKFGADWCGPCRSMDKSLDLLESRFSNRARFLKINVDEKPELFAYYRSGSGVPQIMIFRDGEVIARDRGFGGTEALREWLSSHL